MSTAALPSGWSLLDEPAAGLPAGWTLAEPESKPLTGARVAELAGDVAAEAGGATAGQMIGLAGGPFAPVTVPLGGFIGGGIGNTIAQGRRMTRGEQDGFQLGQLLGAAGISAIPGGQVAKGATVAGRIARSTAVMGGAGAAGNIVQQVIDRPEGQAFDGAQVATAGALGAAGGALVQGGVEGFKALAGLFRRTPPAVFEAATPEEVIAGIARAEGLAPSEIERRIARARNVPPRPPAPELPAGARVGQLDGPPAQLALPEGWTLAPVPAAQADLDAALARQARPSAPATPSAPAQVAPPEPLLAPVDNAPVGAPPPAAIESASPVPPDKMSATQVPPVAAGSPPPSLPEPAPLAAPAQTSGVNQAPTSGDTIAKPGFGGAPDVAPAAPAGKPAITLADAATAQTWASRNADRFKSVTIRENPAGGFDVFTVAKGSKLAFGARPDGGTDIIDHIQSLGGVPPPPKGATGGEWNGFGEVFAGPAKLLVNAKKRGLGLDQFLGNFSDTEFAHLADNPDGFKQTVSDALAERARLKIANTLEENTAKFQTAILTGKGRGGKEPKAGPKDMSDSLNPGDKLAVKGEPLLVTGVDMEGNVTLQDGPRFGTQIIPPGVEIYPDARSLKKLPRETPKASTAPQSDDPFGDNYVPEPDVPAAPQPQKPTNPGEIIPTEEVPFNLAGEEQTVKPSAIEAARAAQESAAQRARNEAAQGNLFGNNSQRGAIDPEVMRAVGFAAARGAAGAAVGTLLADTPEERAGYALAGGLLGVSASPALAKMLGRAAFSTTSVGRRAFPEATIPFDLREQLILKSGAVAATGHRGNNAQRALEVALRKEADPSAAAYEVWQFLTAKIPGVRPSLAAPATEARAALDELSDKLILSGLATGTLADTITAGKGSYLRRAFRIFQSPGWRPEQKVIDDWQAAYLAANPKKTPQDAQDLALELLDRRNAEEFVMTGSLLRQNRDAFKPRKNLDAPTLALLGEITEPVELLGQTVPRMARLVETHETQKNLARIGQAMGHFSAQSDLSRGHIVQLAKDADAPAVGPLAGLWTTPELREALEAATAGQSEQSLVWRTLAGATTLAKFSKTVLNPESWVPNGIGAFIDGVKNGNLRIMANGPAWKDALAVSTEELGFNPQGPAGRAATAALYAKMQRLGLAGQGSSADFQRGLEMAWGETTQRGAKRTMLAFGRGYAFSENVMRCMNFRAEVERYRLAFPLMSPAELDAHAARVVRATTTNYAMIPETVRKASTAGLLGTFVNFPYEQFRHAYNMARIARDDLAQGAATGNQALVKAGASRLAALLAAAAGTGAVAAWSMRKEGISPEQDAAYRRRFAPWDRNQSLIYQVRDGDNIAYMSQSYVNPQAVLLGGGMAAARGESLEEAAMNFLKNGQETFGGGSVLLNPGLETLLNRTERGRQISSPEDSAAKQANDRISYLADRAYSPGFLNSLSRFAKGYKGEAGPDGQVYTLGDAAQRLIGRRINRVNLPYRFEREAFDMNRRLAEVHSSYASVRRREEVNAPEKVDAAYQIGEQRRQVIFKDLRQYIADARVLGYDEEKTVGWMRKGGVPAEIALGALEGRYVPGERLHAKTGAELLAEIRAKPAAEHLSAFVAEVTKNPAFISTIKGAMLDEARGVTQRDKLVAALDPEKRAAYIRQRMEEQSETQRLEYLHELGRKRLLTPETVRQIVKPK